MEPNNMFSIILAGGSGTRLFPLSRTTYPKQFIPLIDNESLFQKSVKRALLHSKPGEIYIVANKEHEYQVKDQLDQLGTKCNILLEPCGKNTLPAITNAVSEIQKRDQTATVLVLPSDQLIDDGDVYKNAVKSAANLAKEYLVAFGIIPTSPHTGYGYILPGEPLKNGYKIDKFVEKPDVQTAEKYLQEGYLWNSGMYCISVDVFMTELRTHTPEIANAFTRTISEAYDVTPAISIDYGLMEKTKKSAVASLNADWSDLGSFDALYAVQRKDSLGNVVKGEYITPDGQNNLIISDDRLVATIGLSDIAVIDTTDALLLCPKKQSQRVSEITTLLKETGDKRADLHTTVHRPWGQYTVLLKGPTYLIKRLTIYPGSRLSLQYHHHRSEHWVIVSGTAEVTNDNETFFVRAGESTFIPAGVKHRLANPGLIPLEVIEVQNGELLTEEDIVRIDDDFHRDDME